MVVTLQSLSCPACKRLLQDPVTLPCGFSLCRECVPAAETIEFESVIKCPFPPCNRGRLHTVAQVQRDRTLQKLCRLLTDKLPPPTADHPQERTAGPSHDAWIDLASVSFIDSQHPSRAESVAPRAHGWTAEQVATIQAELECTICFLVFCEPITLSGCGHTLCRACLIRCLDRHQACPLCRSPLPCFAFYHNQAPNKTLKKFIAFLDPPLPQGYDMDSIRQENQLEPSLAMLPLFVSSLVFPNLPCTLLIFEPRYRRLLQNVLKTESKLFGMVLPRPRRRRGGLDSWEPSQPIATLVKVQAWDVLPNGQWIVEVLGLNRIEILTYSMVDGYLTAASIELVGDISKVQEDGYECEAVQRSANKRIHQNRFSEQSDTSELVINEKDDVPQHSQQQLLQQQQQQQQQQQHSDTNSSETKRFGKGSNVIANVQDSISSGDSAANSHVGRQEVEDEDQILAELVAESETRSFSTLMLRNLRVEELSRKQLMVILMAFVGHMRVRLGPLAMARLERDLGELLVDNDQQFSFWLASALPVSDWKRYEMLKLTSVRARLIMLVQWLQQLESRRSTMCAIC